jgi:hypothetical protein
MSRLVRFSYLLPLLLAAACGGGGTDPAASTPGQQAPIQSDATYNLKQTVANYIQSSQVRNFTVSGTVNGSTVSGSGTTTAGSPQPSSLENIPTQAKTISTTAEVFVNGVRDRLNVAEVSHYDADSNLRGIVGDGYSVASSILPLPIAAKANDAGAWVNLNSYNSSFKTSLQGSIAVTFSLSAETNSTAIATLLYTNRDRQGTFTGSSAVIIRIRTDNSFTILREEIRTPTGSLTFTYAS